jgi:hypothetical protein
LQPDGSIEIDTGSDYSVLGEDWNFVLKVTSDDSTVDPGNMLEYSFSTSLLDGCLLDEFSSPGTINNLIYYIGDTGLHIIPTPSFT